MMQPGNGFGDWTGIVTLDFAVGTTATKEVNKLGLRISFAGIFDDLSPEDAGVRTWRWLFGIVDRIFFDVDGCAQPSFVLSRV